MKRADRYVTVDWCWIYVPCIPNQALRCCNTKGKEEEIAPHRTNMIGIPIMPYNITPRLIVLASDIVQFTSIQTYRQCQTVSIQSLVSLGGQSQVVQRLIFLFLILSPGMKRLKHGPIMGPSLPLTAVFPPSG
jgi:hypothetical protein